MLPYKLNVFDTLANKVTSSYLRDIYPLVSSISMAYDIAVAICERYIF